MYGFCLIVHTTYEFNDEIMRNSTREFLIVVKANFANFEIYTVTLINKYK